MIDIEINNILGSSLGVYLRDRPYIPSARERVNIIEVPGRDGVLTEFLGFEPIDFELVFNFIGNQAEFHRKCDAIKKWLSARNCKLVFGDDPDWYYRVSYFEIDEIERPSNRVGIFSVVVHTVDGLKYSVRGSKELNITDIARNEYLECKPIYKITGNGMCSLTVNGKTVRANVGQNLTIDTELMMAYRFDGTLNNTAISGNYEDLYLRNGSNSVAITTGFNLKVVPNWRCL